VPTVDDMQQIRWNAITAGIPYNSSNAIPKFWLAHPELGSPLAGETALDDGTTAQVFANGVVIWSPQTGTASMA
jgi:LGFP repeat-containing protein